MQRSPTDWSQPGAPLAVVQLLLAFVLGALAIRSAFTMSIAGRRSLSWKALLPIGLMWLGLSISSIPIRRCGWRRATARPALPFAGGQHANDGADDRQSAPHPNAASGAQPAMAGLGIASMAVSLLAFCHPVHLHPMDFVMHLAAIVTIVALTVLVGRRWVALD